MGWDEMGWDGMGWDGMGWDGMGWDGMGWDGVGWWGWDGEGGDSMTLPHMLTVHLPTRSNRGSVVLPFNLTGSWAAPPPPSPYMPTFCTQERLVEGIDVQISGGGHSHSSLVLGTTPSVALGVDDVYQSISLLHERNLSGLYRHSPLAVGSVGVFVQGKSLLEQEQHVPLENGTSIVIAVGVKPLSNMLAR